MANSKYKILLLIIGILLLVNLALLYLLSGCGKNNKPPEYDKKGGFVYEFLQKDIGFSQQQLVRFDSLSKVHKANIRPLFDSLQKAKTFFYGHLGKTEIGDSALNAAADVIGQRQRRVDLQFYQHLVELRALCTPEQLPRYDSLIYKVTRRIIMPFKRGQKPPEDSTAKK